MSYFCLKTRKLYCFILAPKCLRFFGADMSRSKTSRFRKLYGPKWFGAEMNCFQDLNDPDSSIITNPLNVIIHVIFSWAQIGRSAIFGREIGVPDREIFSLQKKIKYNPSHAAIKISINATAAEFICKNIFPIPVQIKKIVKNKIGDIQQIYLYQNVCK